MLRIYNVLLLSVLLLASCRPDTYVPKPRGYYKIDFPEHAYQKFDKPEFPYTFEYPTYATIMKDTAAVDDKPENPYWINMDFPSLGGRIYFSYKTISATEPLPKLLEESFKLSFFHNIRADYINTPGFHNMAHRVYGVVYQVGGNAASAYQFYATDSVKHFLRGALYFDVSPNADSLRPMNEFLKKDIDHMLSTIEWR